MARSTFLLLLIFSLAANGCASALSTLRRPVPYGGVQFDVVGIGGGSGLAPIAALDLIPSAALDTCLLPVTIPCAIAWGSPSIFQGNDLP
jgi:uncharacterized protein YceK